MQRATGEYERTTVAGEEVAAFIPYPLPPAEPDLSLSGEHAELLRSAEEALRRLELAGEMVPSLDWFIYGFVRKEAVVSSQIEGTEATLVDLLAHEASGAEDAVNPDVEEICNYLDALTFTRSEMGRKDGLPLSMRLLNQAHEKLMSGSRGADKLPGEIRRSQNWIGGTRPGNAVFVPPSPHRVADALSLFEKYMHTQSDLPPLVRAALLHVQFESIHPYLDGNGRVGRLLIVLLLEHWGLLSEPLLYLSLFFKRHRNEYDHRLSAVRTDGDWEGWVAYFLEGVMTIAREAADAARELFALVSRDRSKMLSASSGSIVSARLFELLPEHPMLTIGKAIELLDTTRPTATKAMITLVDAGILSESSGKKRDRSFAYAAYLDVLKAGTEL
ncbi:MAG: Fic family protein [Verrucomicrobia bacterium]|nr:Fic family protein [Verrucomicrobiota bacterium]